MVRDTQPVSTPAPPHPPPSCPFETASRSSYPCLLSSSFFVVRPPRRTVPSFAARTFPAQADTIYTAFIDGHREGDINALRSTVTDGLLEGLRRELQAAGGGQAQQSKHRHNRKGGGGSKKRQQQQQHQQKQQKPPPADGTARAFRSAFAVDGFVRKSEVLQMRHGFAGLAAGGSGGARSAANAFAQVTVLVQSRRKVVMVDADGRRVDNDDQGDPTLVEVPSLCVFETSLAEPRGHWRLARIEEIGSQKNQKEEGKSPQ